MATTLTRPETALDATIDSLSTSVAHEGAIPEVAPRTTHSRDEFLSTLALDLWLTAGAFLLFGIIGVVAFGSLVAMAGTFFVAGGAALFGVEAWKNSVR